MILLMVPVRGTLTGNLIDEVWIDSITSNSLGIGPRAGGVSADFEFRSSGIGSLAF